MILIELLCLRLYHLINRIFVNRNLWRQPNKLPFSLPSPCYDLPLQQKQYGI